MDLTVTADELVTAFRRDWPHQYEITMLRLVVAKQQQRISELDSGAGPQVGGELE